LNDTRPLPPRAARPGLADEATRLVAELRGALGARVELLSLELAAALRAAAQIAMLAVAAAIVAVTAWLGLWAVVAGLLVAAGASWMLALAIVIVINAVAAFFAVQRARALVPCVTLAATRRHLTRAPAAPMQQAQAQAQAQARAAQS
jgi:uncharacterized membrane protein YqjE